MTYGLWIALGIAAAWAVRAMQPPEPEAVRAHRPELLAAAAVGAVLGALAGELPMGWHGHALGGRTVLGGLLGGWIAVEVAKRAIGLRQPTGDGFAAPLAAALACGRIGCLTAGCCGPPWVTTIESAFHTVACAALLALARLELLAGRRLAAYLSAYAVLRFALEWWRGYPAVACGLTWYQWLALALLALAGTTWAWRARRS